MNFYIGQKVVCIDPGPFPKLSKGATYTVVATCKCCDTIPEAVCFELRPGFVCNYCETPHPGAMWSAWRFRPLEEEKADLTASLASAWKESVPSEQEHVNAPDPIPA